ncbi:MAG: ABC transporter permease [Promethearchaeota archaeon]
MLNFTYALRDLGKQRTRTVLGIIGISVSIFLLTVVGMLNDSISYSFVDYASQSQGKIDYEISGGYLNYTDLERTIRSNDALSNLFGDFLPRSIIGQYSLVNRSIVNPENGKHQLSYYIGVNLTRENVALQGSFLKTDGTPFQGSLEDNECLLLESTAEKLGLQAGDNLSYYQTQYQDNDWQIPTSVQVTNYTVKEVIGVNFKFGSHISNGIIVNLKVYNTLFGTPENSCSIIVIDFVKPEKFYNAKNIDGTILNIRKVAEKIQNQIGFYNNFHDQYYGYENGTTIYRIGMPRVEILEIEQYVNVGMSIILLFVSFLGMIISGVLINGILSTSIEEKIREFGIFRVLGAHKNFPIKLTTAQALILSTIGTALGVIIGYVAVSYGILPLIARTIKFSIGEPKIVISFDTITTAVGVGVGMSMLAGIFPAFKASKMRILSAINPYRQETVGTKMVREESINYKYIMIGAITSSIAAFVLFIVPQILLTMDLGLIVAVLVILLTTFLVGATFIGLGFLPVVQGIFRRLLTLLSRKTRDIIKISLIRYTRRNVTTVLMFSISFSFITLVSSVLNTQSAQNIEQVHNRNGSDLAIDARFGSHDYEGGGLFPFSSSLPSTVAIMPQQTFTIGGKAIPDQAFAQELLNFEGVSKVSSILATTRELDVIKGSDYSITLYDRVKYKSSRVHGVAIDKNYLDTVYNKFILFSQGNTKDSFTRLFEDGDNVIISTSLALSMHFNLNDVVLLSFEWGNDDEVRYVEFTIVGIVDNLPGIPSVEKSVSSSFMGGSSADGAAIILNQDNFRKYFQLPAGNYYVSKVFIKLSEGYQDVDDSKIVERAIKEKYEDSYVFDTDNSFREGQFQKTIFGYVEILFLIILTFAVIISLFGLISAAYSTILERTREIGIIETLGLRKRNIANMFIIESEIIMISAALNGSLIGIILTAIFYLQMDAFSSFPIISVYTIPWNTIFLELGIAAIACLIAMKLLVRRVQKMELIEIFRKTL